MAYKKTTKSKSAYIFPKKVYDNMDQDTKDYFAKKRKALAKKKKKTSDTNALATAIAKKINAYKPRAKKKGYSKKRY